MGEKTGTLRFAAGERQGESACAFALLYYNI